MIAQSLFQPIVIADVKEHALETSMATVRDAPSLDPTRRPQDIPGVAQPIERTFQKRTRVTGTTVVLCFDA